MMFIRSRSIRNKVMIRSYPKRGHFNAKSFGQCDSRTVVDFDRKIHDTVRDIEEAVQSATYSSDRAQQP
jgi:hypothetical protein